MERKQDHSSCPNDIGAGHRRRTLSNSERRGECQSAPASLVSSPNLLRREGPKSIDSSVRTDDQNVTQLGLSPASPIPQEAVYSEEYSQVKPKTIPLEDIRKILYGSDSTYTLSSSSFHEAAGTDEAGQEDSAAISLEPRGVQESGREFRSSVPRSRVWEHTGALETSPRKTSTVSLEAARQGVAPASRKSATTEQDDPEMGQSKGIDASLSQARELARSSEDSSIPSTSAGHTGTQGRKLSTTATHETAGGASAAAQREYAGMDSAHVPLQDSRERERVQSREDIDIGASTSQGFLGMQQQKPSGTAIQHIPARTAMAPQLRRTWYYAPRPRPASQVPGHLSLREEYKAASTSTRCAVIQGGVIQGGTIVAGRVDSPREEHYEHGHRDESREQEPSESEDDNTTLIYIEYAGTGGRERSSSVPHDTAPESFVAAQLKEAEESHQAARGTIVAGQVDNPREEHYARGHPLESRGQEPSVYDDDNNTFTSMEHAGTGRRERSSSVPRNTAPESYVTAQLKDAREQHGTPGRRQQSPEEELTESEVAKTTSHRNIGIQEEHSSVASTSHAGLVTRDSQDPSPTKRHRRKKGESDNHSATEQIYSGGVSSGVTSSGATGAASAFPSMPPLKAYVRTFDRLTEKSRRPGRPCKKAAASETEEAAGRAPSDLLNPVEGRSSGTLSEPTQPEGHSHAPLDPLIDLRARANYAVLERIRRRFAETTQLRTDIQQLRLKVEKFTRSVKEELQRQADFIHSLRVKLDEEKAEKEKMKKTRKMKKDTMQKEEHVPAASASSADLVPRDSQEKFPERHRKAKGDSDNHSAPEEISSGDESSAVATSRATEAASAYPSMQAAGTALSDGADPIEGTSRGTLSEPTITKHHSALSLDYVHELRKQVNDALDQMFDQMNAGVHQLSTQVQQLRIRIRAHERLNWEEVGEQARFIHDLRVKLDEEAGLEEKWEEENEENEDNEKKMKDEK